MFRSIQPDFPSNPAISYLKGWKYFVESGIPIY
jgi:hypothetical protein